MTATYMMTGTEWLRRHAVDCHRRHCCICRPDTCTDHEPMSSPAWSPAPVLAALAGC